MRQTEFDNYLTTDDHGMHITGIAKDQNGTKYYIVKNSWAWKAVLFYKGYFYASEAYVRLKTMDIMINKLLCLRILKETWFVVKPGSIF
ncbi:MAG: C1 family peptidase [Bacteroidales bacterium]